MMYWSSDSPAILEGRPHIHLWYHRSISARCAEGSRTFCMDMCSNEVKIEMLMLPYCCSWPTEEGFLCWWS